MFGRKPSLAELADDRAKLIGRIADLESQVRVLSSNARLVRTNMEALLRKLDAIESRQLSPPPGSGSGNADSKDKLVLSVIDRFQELLLVKDGCPELAQTFGTQSRKSAADADALQAQQAAKVQGAKEPESGSTYEY